MLRSQSQSGADEKSHVSDIAITPVAEVRLADVVLTADGSVLNVARGELVPLPFPFRLLSVTVIGVRIVR